MRHIRRCYHNFSDQNKTGRITYRTAHNYEGICNSPLISLALLSSGFLILGTEINP